MMPKEKAKELVYKYSHLITSWDCYWDTEIPIEDRMEQMIECALIAVDEIMKQCFDYRDIDLQASYDYWEEVKQEIEKL